MNNKLEKILEKKKSSYDIISVQSRHFTGESEENHDKPNCPDRVPPEYKARALPLHQSTR
jgi:hypothetical protein